MKNIGHCSQQQNLASVTSAPDSNIWLISTTSADIVKAAHSDVLLSVILPFAATNWLALCLYNSCSHQFLVQLKYIVKYIQIEWKLWGEIFRPLTSRSSVIRNDTKTDEMDAEQLPWRSNHGSDDRISIAVRGERCRCRRESSRNIVEKTKNSNHGSMKCAKFVRIDQRQ